MSERSPTTASDPLATGSAAGVLPGGETSPERRELADYLEAVASGAPTPGGGSVVAVVAALGAALGAMVANLTLARSFADPTAAELRDARAALDHLRHRLLPLAAADEAAYGAYRAAAALPKRTEAERAGRAAALDHALLASTDVPLAVAAACVELADRLAPITRVGNRHLLADAQIAAWLTETALRGALLNLRGNAALMRDLVAADRYRRRADVLETAGRAAIGHVLAVAASRSP